MAIDGATQTELNAWAQQVIAMNLDVAPGPAEAGLAGQASARVWAEHGDPDMARAMQVIITEAVKTGYSRALRDIQEGTLDADIARWRPRLARD